MYANEIGTFFWISRSKPKLEWLIWGVVGWFWKHFSSYRYHQNEYIKFSILTGSSWKYIICPSETLVYCSLYFFFFSWRIIALQSCVSAIQQCESAISIHMSPPSWASHPSRLSLTELSSLVLYSNFPLAIYFTNGNVYVLMLLSQFIHSLLPPSDSVPALQIASLVPFF